MDHSGYRCGQPFTDHDFEWIGLGCPRCGRSWEHRRPQLEQAYKAAIAAGSQSVTVPAA
jgi:hypothetical protein